MRRALDRLYDVSGALAAVCLAAICFLMLAQSFARELGLLLRGADDITGWLTAASAFLALPLLAGGCPDKGSSPPPPTSIDGRDSRVLAMAQRTQPAPDGSPRDAAPVQTIFFQMDVYRLAVPLGTFSSNEDFWKRMDEDLWNRLILQAGGIDVLAAPEDPLTGERLRRSETHVGRSSRQDWPA